MTKIDHAKRNRLSKLSRDIHDEQERIASDAAARWLEKKEKSNWKKPRAKSFRRNGRRK